MLLIQTQATPFPLLITILLPALFLSPIPLLFHLVIPLLLLAILIAVMLKLQPTLKPFLP